MNQFEVDIQFIDTSGWQELTWYNSGGTRAKKVLQDLGGKEYYFKCSEKKPAKDGKPEKHYKYEFWNEIIAYQLGKGLGLNVLRYDVAVFDGEIGCLSPKMNITDDEQLIEVGRFMTAINSSFLPEDNSTRKEYTFQLLVHTFDVFKLTPYLEFIIQTLLFDSLIGNTDRHQENWAFIGKSSLISESLQSIEKLVKEKGLSKFNKPLRSLFTKLIDKDTKELNQVGKAIELYTMNISKTAPIYDSGSSLARELTEERVELLLESESELLKYIFNGKSELHWEGAKISHYLLVEKLLNSSYQEQVLLASSFLEKWCPELIIEILDKLDKDIPHEWYSYCIPNNRKQLINKILSLRFNNLKHLLSAGV